MIESLFLAGVIAAAAVEPAAPDKSLEYTAPASLSEQFLDLCGSDQALTTKLPGEDVELANAPFQLRQYAEQAISSRIVKIGDRHAMRAQNAARADPVHAIVIRCGLTGSGAAFSDEVGKLTEKLATTPSISKTQGGLDAASFRSGVRSFHVYAEPDGSVSIFSLDIMMRNIDPKYLKKGTKPVPLPPAQ